MQDKINILNELKEAGAVFLINADNRNYFSVPEGYFSNLADNVLAHVFVQSLPTVNPYTVPESYFENLNEIVFEKINIGDNIETLRTAEKNIYSVPEGYFNNLADNIFKKIRQASAGDSVQQELEEISPFISKISRTNIYSVPDNYFDELNPAAIAADHHKPAAKIISIGSSARKWMRYAVAACIAAIMFAGGYLYFSGSKPKDDSISSLSKMDVEKEISFLSDDEITNYLKENNNIAVYTNMDSGEDPQQNMDIQSLLQNVSDEEIQQYLNQDPESGRTGEGI